jgi:hypothetical protein
MKDEGKAFFFEKKQQKTFIHAVADLLGKSRDSISKSFLVLFSKKDCFPSACE